MQPEEQAIYSYIGEKLKEKRKSLGFTQEHVARKVDSTRTSIANIETGYQKPPIHFLFKLCIFLDLEVKEVIPNTSLIRSLKQTSEPVQKQFEGQELTLPPMAAGVLEELMQN